MDSRERGKETHVDIVWEVPVNQSKKQECLLGISRAVQQKKIRYYPSFSGCILKQLRFQSGQYWLINGSILLAAILLTYYLNYKGAEGGMSIAVCSLFMVLAGNICLSGVIRLFSWHMAELEQTLYLNLKQMVCIHMLAAGIMDSIVLALIVLITGTQYDGGAGVYLLYLLVPFLWSDVVYLHLLTVFRGGMRGYRQLAAGFICGILALFPVMLENAYHLDYVPVWGIFAICGTGGLIMEIRRMLGKLEGGEGLCLN